MKRHLLKFQAVGTHLHGMICLSVEFFYIYYLKSELTKFLDFMKSK